MTRYKLGDAAILIVCVIGAVAAAVWGIDQAPREYGLLVVVLAIGAVLMARKLLRD